MIYTSSVISYKISTEKEGRKKINFYKHTLNLIWMWKLFAIYVHIQYKQFINDQVRIG